MCVCVCVCKRAARWRRWCNVVVGWCCCCCRGVSAVCVCCCCSNRCGGGRGAQMVVGKTFALWENSNCITCFHTHTHTQAHVYTRTGTHTPMSRAAPPAFLVRGAHTQIISSTFLRPHQKIHLVRQSASNMVRDIGAQLNNQEKADKLEMSTHLAHTLTRTHKLTQHNPTKVYINMCIDLLMTSFTHNDY